MKHLHITGCRRSGTTLLFEMLSTCFVHTNRCEHEQSIFVDINADIDVQGDGLYLSKKPSDITHIQRVFDQDPNLFLIYILRDPRAVITSIHPSRGDVYYASFERWQRYEQAARAFQGHARFLQVRYEDLVTQPDQVQKAIRQKFGFLQQEHAFSDFHLHAASSKKAQISLKGLRPISTSGLDNWQNHLPRIQFQLEAYPQLEEAIRHYDYEPNNNWLQLLNGIPAKAQTYGEKRPGVFKRLETDVRCYLKSLSYLRRRKA